MCLGFGNVSVNSRNTPGGVCGVAPGCSADLCYLLSEDRRW